VAAIGGVVLLVAVLGALRYMGFLRAPVYDTTPPVIAGSGRPMVLVFSKTNGFIHREAIPAARALIERLAAEEKWDAVVTDNAAVHNPGDLSRFAAIVWNNVSGDVLTGPQRAAMQAYIEGGGGFVGLHGSGGDLHYAWRWYVDRLIGAQFIGHPLLPQFQRATVTVDRPADPIVRDLPARWARVDEWYSFQRSPRLNGAQVLLSLDERTYSPRLLLKDLGMGPDHPVVWTRCVGRGRAFYSAMGHTAETYAEPEYAALLRRGLGWAMGAHDSCGSARSLPAADTR
jgi:type 1 glutamine amidotransferase